MERLERLINLVIALRETRVPLSAAEIRERVAGYGQADKRAFRRMFERDKADLRALGVPIALEPLDRWGDEHGYRIDPRRYDLPQLDLSAEELTALALAVEATGLGDELGAGLRKLETAAGMPGVTAAAGGPVIGVHLDPPRREVLWRAQHQRITVRFTYRRPGGPAEERTVDPHGLVHRGGHWYLVGHDRSRQARRAFRLDRILGEVQAASEPGAFPPPTADVAVDDVVPAAPPGPSPVATVAARAEVAWRAARRAREPGEPGADGRIRYQVTVRDPDEFVAWVLPFGPDLVVLDPPALRQRVVDALHDVVENAGPKA